MGGGAWPFLVGGLPCQVDSGNERDFYLIISFSFNGIDLYLILASYRDCFRIMKGAEAEGNNRSVMPLDVLGCTRATMVHEISLRYAKV